MTANHIGKTIYFAAAAPATNDSTGFEALTWVQVKGAITLPQLGVSHSMVDIPDLQSGFTSAVKGAAQGVESSATFRDVASDTGQGNVKTASTDQQGIGSIKIVNGSGTDNAPVTGDVVEYAQGVVHSYQPNQAESGGYEGFTVSFRQNDFTVAATEPV